MIQGEPKDASFAGAMKSTLVRRVSSTTMKAGVAPLCRPGLLAWGTSLQGGDPNSHGNVRAPDNRGQVKGLASTGQTDRVTVLRGDIRGAAKEA